MRKVCKVCQIDKDADLTNFPPSKRHKDGFDSRCRECIKQQKKEYNAANKARIDEYNHQYYQEHTEEVKARTKKYKGDNVEYYAEYDKEYKLVHKDELVKKHKEYRSTPERKKVRNKYEKDKKTADPIYRIVCNLRTRISNIISGTKKPASAVDDLGCSTDELRKHLEQSFHIDSRSGEVMSWKNYGFNGWHIDHIMPLSAFDLTNREQFIKAVHYTNLQPLWWWENLEKADKILENGDEKAE